MLYLVGIGLKPKHLTLEALELLRECDKVYLETYTSQYSEGTKTGFEELIGKKTIELGRKEVEEGFDSIFEEAEKQKIALCIYGNPLGATTHLQVLLDASKKGIKTQIIPGMGIFEFTAFTGLERYKFGKTTSIVFHEEYYEPESFYDVIIQNKNIGLHTLCLLDIRKDEDRLMSIRNAIDILESIEEKREQSVLNDTIMIGIAGLGGKGQQIKADNMERLKNFNFTSFPQSLIVCGKLNEKEVEGLRELSDLE